ncbi:MAG: PLP-dependent cysteine synthase family protein [Pseudomonadota bacterium]
MADYNRSSDTHLIKLDLPCLHSVDLYLKDESTHPSGSLKHRLARSLFLYALCNGMVRADTPVIEASSGSTAISEAYFARLLGLRFICVVPKSTAREKIATIEFYGGECQLVDPKDIYGEAQALAESLGGHYMDQFTFAERATDWRGNNNIAESIFSQLAKERFPIPDWVVVSAGTGGTSATIGRYLRYRPELYARSRLCVVDPEFSVFYDSYRTGDCSLTSDRGSRIEGIGRPRVEPSFQPRVIDRMIKIPDAASLATIWWLEDVLGRKCGASTGTNLYGALKIAAEMMAAEKNGSIVSMICDPGERYLQSYFSDTWLAEQGIDIAPYRSQLEAFAESGRFEAA